MVLGLLHKHMGLVSSRGSSQKTHLELLQVLTAHTTMFPSYSMFPQSLKTSIPARDPQAPPPPSTSNPMHCHMSARHKFHRPFFHQVLSTPSLVVPHFDFVHLAFISVIVRFVLDHLLWFYIDFSCFSPCLFCLGAMG